MRGRIGRNNTNSLIFGASLAVEDLKNARLSDERTDGRAVAHLRRWVTTGGWTIARARNV
jgi:hypothetical protein